MTTPNNDQFPQYPGNGAGDPNQFQNQYGGVDPNAQFVQPPKHSGLAIGSLVVGILAVLTGWIPVLGWILVLAGVILSIIALISANKKGNKKSLAITGLVLSIIGGVIAMGLVWFGSQLANDVTEQCGTDTTAPGYDECVQEYTNDKFGVQN